MGTTSRQLLMQSVVKLLNSRLPAGISCVGADGEIRIVDTKAGKELTPGIPLTPLFVRAEKSSQDSFALTQVFAERVLAIVRGHLKELTLEGAESRIYPVLRHSSFVRKNPERWVHRQHTEQTSILYALDDAEGYRLIERDMLGDAGWTAEELHRHAISNLQQMPIPKKQQKVGPHLLTFITTADGYAASRILLSTLIDEMESSRTGDILGVAIPHPDVLVFGDLHGDSGAELLSRLAYDFASKSSMPISPLPFVWEAGELIPIVVVAHEKKGSGRQPGSQDR
ncbi:DUF1444 family protein [Brevibacillus borstelensis]|uniref:DUF1444 family protein n=1 Tax=Brevibacillus borstelensis TaxID=45462 RepID=UPI0030BDA91E